MNLNLKNLAFLAVGAALLSLPVQAQTYSRVVSDTNGEFSHRKATITSASTIAWDNVANTQANHTVIMSTTSASMPAVILFALGDGTVVTSQTVTLGAGPTVVSQTRPLNYQKFKVSPTGLLGTGTVSVDSVGNRL